jgi:hypothetical protein
LGRFAPLPAVIHFFVPGEKLDSDSGSQLASIDSIFSPPAIGFFAGLISEKIEPIAIVNFCQPVFNRFSDIFVEFHIVPAMDAFPPAQQGRVGYLCDFAEDIGFPANIVGLYPLGFGRG